MQLRYKGSFQSITGLIWWVLIYQDQLGTVTAVGDLTFETDAVTIDWAETDKEEPMCGSTLTLNIESPGDRTYLDLYTVKPGAVKVEVWKGGTATTHVGGALWWCGTLDPEFYEEPYERASRYPVSLTFSDLGILKRMSYDLTGIQSVKSIVFKAIEKSGLGTSIDYSLISTKYNGKGQSDLLDSLHILSDNFTDEDGEVSTYYEVLEGVLQPLGLRLIQRAGKIWLYDLNGLATSGNAVAHEWDGNSQTLATDKVANSAKVTFSPYGQAQMIDGNISADSVPEEGDRIDLYVNLKVVKSESAIDRGETLLDGLTMWVNKTAPASLPITIPATSDARIFKTSPIYSGSEECGIMGACKKTKLRSATSEGVNRRGENGFYENYYGKFRRLVKANADSTLISNWHSSELFSVNAKPFIYTTPAASDGRPSAADLRKAYIHITMPLMIDGRYNPYEGEEDNQSDFYVWIRKNYQFVYVPVKIELEGVDGKIYHYQNHCLAARLSSGWLGIQTNFSHGGYCGWYEGAAEWNQCYLCYYDYDNRTSGTGILGWQNNKPMIGYYTGELPGLWKKRGDGEYIELPPVSGTLSIKVGQGVQVFHRDKDKGRVVSTTYVENETTDGSANEVWGREMRWLLYKVPTVKLANYVSGEAVEDNDIEYYGAINGDAEEAIEISTICGTGAANSSARGSLRDSRGVPIDAVTRAGITDAPEQLLIGTLFSQYYDRCIKLSGESVLSVDGLTVYTEANQGDRLFMIKSESANLREHTSDVTLVEVRPDNYVGV